MSNNIQTPTVGRIVLFHLGPNHGLPLNVSPLPAIITRVWSDDMINVVVFPDGYGQAQLAGVTSARYADTKDEQDRQSYSWSWPPRV